MRIEVPEGKDPIRYVWGELVPGIGPAAARFSQSVYDDGTLGLREFEAARLRIAQVNGCLNCCGLAHRAGRRHGRGLVPRRRHRLAHDGRRPASFRPTSARVEPAGDLTG